MGKGARQGQGPPRRGQGNPPHAAFTVITRKRQRPAQEREYQERLDLVRNCAQEQRRPLPPAAVIQHGAGAHLVPKSARYQATGWVEALSAIGGEEVGRRGRHRLCPEVIGGWLRVAPGAELLFDQISHYHYYNSTNGSWVDFILSTATDKHQIKLHTHLHNPFNGILSKLPPRSCSLLSSCILSTTTSFGSDRNCCTLLSLNFRATQRHLFKTHKLQIQLPSNTKGSTTTNFCLQEYQFPTPNHCNEPPKKSMVHLIFLSSMPQSPLPVRKSHRRTGPRRRTVRPRTRSPRPPRGSPPSYSPPYR